MDSKALNVGIGFATGRRSFRKVLRTNIFSWRESGLTEEKDVRLNLLVAYDLEYSNTKPADYTHINKRLLDLIDDTCFIGKAETKKEINNLANAGVVSEEEARLIFAAGYAGKRNIVLYMALKRKMDYLIYLDDDEYPMAVTKTRASAVWGGQNVLTTHLNNIQNADITNGHHCGYISPIPYIEFDQVLSEPIFRSFIEAISNDIVNWEAIRKVMANGGVTYADTGILTTDEAFEVIEVNNAKFISGANLCINLTNPQHVSPFYNPPGARGEDTFLSTCLRERKVLRVPCYTFHDGFSTYQHLLDGVLPTRLKYIRADTDHVRTRFYQACIGWVRYKPLFTYITQPERYEEVIAFTRSRLDETLPKICAYFGREDFMNIKKELDRYHRNVKKHRKQFLDAQLIWGKICDYLSEQQQG